MSTFIVISLLGQTSKCCTAFVFFTQCHTSSVFRKLFSYISIHFCGALSICKVLANLLCVVFRINIRDRCLEVVYGLAPSQRLVPKNGTRNCGPGYHSRRSQLRLVRIGMMLEPGRHCIFSSSGTTAAGNGQDSRCTEL